MTTLRSAIADELDKRAQEFMSRHEVTYIQALRAVLPEESHMSKYTTATATAEVDDRAQRYASQHQGISYKQALDAVLAADPELRTAYGQPAPRVARMAITDPREKPAVPVPADVEREVKDWITRALEAGMVGSLPGALGQLSIEADKLAKTGMPVEEASSRAMDAHPHLVTQAKLLLVDLRRNEPDLVPTGEDKPAQGNAAGYLVHARAVKLQQANPNLDYRTAMRQVLDGDHQLKVNYGVQS